MKVLLFGEYSGLYKNLKEGLRELGHEVTHAGVGDGFKAIPVDLNLQTANQSIWGKIYNRMIPFLNLRKMQGFDVVQLINPLYFDMKFFPRDYFFEKLIQGNDKFFITAAGDDAFYWSRGRKEVDYGPFDDFLKYDMQQDSYWMESEYAKKMNQKMLDLCVGVIPVMYEYEVAYKGCDKRLETIPLPINTGAVDYVDNKVKGDRIVIFHGLNRYGFKGTRHVEEAFKYLNAKYPHDVEAIIDGRLPLDQYLKVMQRANVIVDQMYSYSLGMNAVYAMAMGKVVIGGAEPESLASLGIKSSPAINVKPSADDLIAKIEALLQDKSKIESIGFESRKFVEEVHDYRRVADKYVNVWERS